MAIAGAAARRLKILSAISLAYEASDGRELRIAQYKEFRRAPGKAFKVLWIHPKGFWRNEK